VSVLRTALAIAILLTQLGACAVPGEGLGYYWQSVRGHWSVMQRAKPIEVWLADPATEPGLRQKLLLAQEARKFASRELGLPDNGSYTKYVDLQRPSVVWNVFATPELSMQLKQWCYPVVGCATYRGFYAKVEAEHYAEHLRGQGLEAYVAGIPAYSTLGWFDDPLLSSFIRYPDAELARTIFHELAHQVLYIKGDTTFNESFASAVEEIGLAHWFETQAERVRLESNYREFSQRRKDFVTLLKKHRRALEAVYVREGSDDDKRRGKAEVFAALKVEYAVLKISWKGFGGYDLWFSQTLSNAHLATVATYSDLVPGFLLLHQRERVPDKLLESTASDGAAGSPRTGTLSISQAMRRFFEASRDLSTRPKAERDEILGLPKSVP
jgi:predicted aminopeptidase